MSDDEDGLYDESLPGEQASEDGRLLRYIVLGVLAILLYAVVTLFLAATGLSL